MTGKRGQVYICYIADGELGTDVLVNVEVIILMFYFCIWYIITLPDNKRCHCHSPFIVCGHSDQVIHFLPLKHDITSFLSVDCKYISLNGSEVVIMK